jgi:hypothetical protein
VHIKTLEKFCEILEKCQGVTQKQSTREIIKNDNRQCMYCYYCSACDRTFNTRESFDVHPLHVSRFSEIRYVSQKRLQSIEETSLVPPCEECFQYFCDRTPLVPPKFGIWGKVYARNEDAIEVYSKKLDNIQPEFSQWSGLLEQQSKDYVLESEVLMCPVCYTFLKNRSIKEISLARYRPKHNYPLINQVSLLSFNNRDKDTKSLPPFNKETDTGFWLRKLRYQFSPSINNRNEDTNSETETGFLTDLQEDTNSETDTDNNSDVSSSMICQVILDDIIDDIETGFLTDLQEVCRKKDFFGHFKRYHSRTSFSIKNLVNCNNLLSSRSALGTNPIGLPVPAIQHIGQNTECWLTPEDTRILEQYSQIYSISPGSRNRKRAPCALDYVPELPQPISAIEFNTEYPGVEFLVAKHKNLAVTTSTTPISTHYFNTTPVQFSSKCRKVVQKKDSCTIQRYLTIPPQNSVLDPALPPQDPAADYLDPVLALPPPGPVFELKYQFQVRPNPFVLVAPIC